MHIDLASAEHGDSLVELLCEMNAYYNPDSPAAREVVREHAYMNLVSSASPQKLVVATSKDGKPVGLAAIMLIYSFVEPEPACRLQCQLKELYVSSVHRGKGYGRALMQWVSSHALEQGCSRIDWPVNAGNADGISFYKSLGSKQLEDRLNFRLNGSSMQELASGKRGVA